MVDAAVLAGQESAQIVSRVRVVDFDGVVILSSDPNDGVTRLAVTDGEVTHDDTAEIKGSARLTIQLDSEHESLVPQGPSDPLSPIAEVMVEVSVGARNTDTGAFDLEKQGLFEIRKTEISEDGGGIQLDLELEDKHRKLSRARFYKPRQIAKGTNYAEAITFLLISVLPESQINITPTTHTTPLLSWDIEDDRLVALGEMFSSIGYIMRLDGDGNAEIQPDTDATDDPVWSFIQGPDTQIETISGYAKAVKAKRTLSDEQTYNGVVALGEATGDNKARVKAEAWDTNPNSLTYYDPAKPDESRYGPVPFFYSSPFITTQAQALSAAKSRLPKVAGIVERVEVTTLMNARVKCGDVVQIERPRIGAHGTFIVESVTKPMLAGQMSVTLRERRIFD